MAAELFPVVPVVPAVPAAPLAKPGEFVIACRLI